MAAVRLFLLPTCLGDTATGDVLPAAYLSRIENLRVFFVEDLRSARRFLRKLGFSTPFEEVLFIELNEHTRESCLENVLDKAGIDPALLNRDMGVLSEASGPSSIFMALMASGFNGQNFAFSGYLPVPPQERRNRIAELENRALKSGQTQIFIETPYRSQQMFLSLLESCRPQTQLCVACNITLPDEFIVTRSIADWKKAPAELQKKNTVFLISA